MSREIRYAFLEFSNHQKITTTKKIYVIKDQQRAIFQLNYFQSQGFSLTNDNLLSWLGQHSNLTNLSLSNIQSISESVSTKQQEKILEECFSYVEKDPSAECLFITRKDLRTSKLSQMALKKFIEASKENKGEDSYSEDNFYTGYLKGCFYEYGIVYETDLQLSLSNYSSSRKSFGCQSSAVKEMKILKDRNLKNQIGEEEDFEALLQIFGQVCLDFGFIQFEKNNYEYSSPLLHYISILLDTSNWFQRYFYSSLEEVKYFIVEVWVSNNPSDALEYFTKNKSYQYSSKKQAVLNHFFQKIKKDDESYENKYKNGPTGIILLYKIMLAMVFELDYSEHYFLKCYSLLNYIKETTEFQKTSNFLGDMLHPSFYGSPIKFSLDDRLQLYSSCNNHVKVICKLYRYARNLHRSFCTQEFEESFKDIVDYMIANKVGIHPQIIEILTDFYFLGGKVDYTFELDHIFGILPIPKTKRALLEHEENGSPANRRRSRKRQYSIIRKQKGLLEMNYLKYFHRKKWRPLILLLNFKFANGQESAMRPYYYLLHCEQDELAPQIAIKGIKMGKILDNFSVILTNQEKGKKMNSKFERAVQGYQELFEDWLKHIEEKNYQFGLNPPNSQFSVGSQDYTQSYIIYKLFETGLQANISEDTLMNFLKVAFTLSMIEMDDILSKELPLNYFSLYCLFKVMRFVGNQPVMIELAKLIIFSRFGGCYFFLIGSSHFFERFQQEQSSNFVLELRNQIREILQFSTGNEFQHSFEIESFRKRWKLDWKNKLNMLKDGINQDYIWRKSALKKNQEIINKILFSPNLQNKRVNSLISESKKSIASFIKTMKQKNIDFSQRKYNTAYMIHSLTNQLQRQLLGIDGCNSSLIQKYKIEDFGDKYQHYKIKFEKMLDVGDMITKNSEEIMLSNKEFQLLRDKLYGEYDIKEIKNEELENINISNLKIRNLQADLYDAQLIKNCQKVKLVRKKIITITDITRFFNALPAAKSLHPQILGVLGCNFEDKISHFEVNIIMDNFEQKVDGWFDKMKTEVLSSPTFIQDILYMIYKILLCYISAKISDLPIGFLNRNFLVLDALEQPKFILPFFCDYYHSLPKYIEILIENQQVDELSDYHPALIYKVFEKEQIHFGDREIGYFISMIAPRILGFRPFEAFNAANDYNKLLEYIKGLAGTNLNQKYINNQFVFICNKLKILHFPQNSLKILSFFYVSSFIQHYKQKYGENTITLETSYKMVLNLCNLLESYLANAGLEMVGINYFHKFLLNFGDFDDGGEFFERNVILPNNLSLIYSNENKKQPNSAMTSKFAFKSTLVFSCQHQFGGLSSLTYYFDNNTILTASCESNKIFDVEISCKIDGHNVTINFSSLQKKLKMISINDIFNEFSKLQEAAHFKEYLKGISKLDSSKFSFMDEYTGYSFYASLLEKSKQTYKDDFKSKYHKLLKKFEGISKVIKNFDSWMNQLKIKCYRGDRIVEGSSILLSEKDNDILFIFDNKGNLVLSQFNKHYKPIYDHGVLIQSFSPEMYLKTKIYSNDYVILLL